MSIRLHRAIATLTFLVLAVGSTLSAAENVIQDLIAQAKDGSELIITRGTHKDPITIDRPLVLKGNNPETCILAVTADEPAITVSTKGPVTIEGMTIAWQLATSDGRRGPACAVVATDSKVTMRDCRLIALGNDQRCPSAIASSGFSRVSLENCRFEGFNFTIGYAGGSEGTISDCVILNPGHCGVTVYSGSTIEVARNIITGSKYHAVRSTGGTLKMHDNLIINNKNRGVYLGNKSASGRINNNVILSNGTGISAFAQTDVTIHNNVILDSSYAGLGTRDSCRIKVRNNLFQDNTRGIALFEETGRIHVDVGRNSFWNNETDAENFELPPTTILVNPQLAAPEQGSFMAQAEELTSNRQGLTDAEVFVRLWDKWQEVVQDVE